MLNRFIIGLVRAALGLKQQRIEAEAARLKREEEERGRRDEERRLAEAELRWREEEGRVERLEHLVELWRRHQELRSIMDDLRKAVGDVMDDSELARWLTWAEDHLKQSDPLRHLRARSGRTLTLYYYGYDKDFVAERGFTEPTQNPWDKAKTPAGVELTIRPPRPKAWESALKLHLEEDLVLPYEWVQESDWRWRLFNVPASVLNRLLGYPIGADDMVMDE